MSNSASHSKLKFLRDENVKKRLEKFLIQQGFDVTIASKKTPDDKLAQLSKSEQRVLITNDNDFVELSEENIFSIVWLRIPQDKPESLILSFSKLLNEIKPEDFKGNLITLYEDRFEVSPIS